MIDNKELSQGDRVGESGSDFLDVLIRHELTIKRLYESFSELFESHRIFWQRIAADEQRHADLIAEIRPRFSYEKRLYPDIRLTCQGVATSIGYIEDQIARAQKGGFSLLQALSVARDIESALLERQLSRMDGTDIQEIGPILKTLVIETGLHFQKIVEALNRVKRKIP